jgi:LDH2 family malate/lactate/ureidoglycolate dehydrogenase
MRSTPSAETEALMPQPGDTPALTDADLEAESADALPDRRAMSKLGFDVHGVDNFAAVINEASAANIASEDSVAIADADQTVIVIQADED